MYRSLTRQPDLRMGLLMGLLIGLSLLLLSACGSGGTSGAGGSGGGEHQQAKARPLPEEAKALPPGEYHSEEFKPAFSFHVGKGWRSFSDLKEVPDRLIIESAEEVKGYSTLLIFRNVHEVYDARKRKWVNVNSSEEVVSWFQHHPYLKTEKPQPVTVGGVKGVQFDTAVAKDSPTSAVQSFRYSDGFVASIDRGPKGRTIVLDVKGEPVSIGVG